MVFTLTHLTPIGWVLLCLFRLQLPNKPKVYARNSQLRLVEIPVQNFTAGWERTNQLINGIQWPYIRPKFQGLSQQNTAENMVRLRTSILGSWRSPIEQMGHGVCEGYNLQISNVGKMT